MNWGGWSVAWRIHDARFWGVPQRRRRIALVADFGGLSAGEILFERKGLCRYSPQSEREKSFTARGNRQSTEAENKRYYDNHPQDSRITGPHDTANSVSAKYGTGGCNTPVVLHSYGIQGNTINRQPQNGGNGTGYREEEIGTLNTIDRRATTYSLGKGGYMIEPMKNETLSLMQSDYKDPPITVKPTYSAGNDYHFTNAKKEEIDTIASSDYKDPNKVYVSDGERYIARRITPLECERLQGFPDGWTDIGEWTDSKGRKHESTDSMRYKALGNSIALPYWKVLARRIAAQYDRDITIGSLFDGIGGFILAFNHCGAECLWSSEIEEFPIAVTKYHFGGTDDQSERQQKER